MRQLQNILRFDHNYRQYKSVQHGISNVEGNVDDYYGNIDGFQINIAQV